MSGGGPSVAGRRRRTGHRGAGGRRRLAVFLLGLFALLLGGGFVVFAQHVDGLAGEAGVERADGVVVWTGKGGGRLETAGRLLAAESGERLLVSGVNTQLDAARVAELSGLDDDTAACCLDIDYAAQDTAGNARETAMWAEALGYEHIILVTSAYHMPRARLELGHAAPGLRVSSVAVEAPDAGAWWADGARFRRLSGEYGKYLLSLARGRAGEREAIPEPVEPLPDAPEGGTDPEGRISED